MGAPAAAPGVAADEDSDEESVQELVAAARGDVDHIEIAGYTVQQALERLLTTLTGVPAAGPMAPPTQAAAPPP
eukprot:3213978-Pyramimonas_sp.AAC.1